MIDYKINKFFNKEECEFYIEKAMEIGTPFKYDPKEHWDCRRVYDNDFKEKIFNRYKEMYNNGDIKLWFNFEDLNVKNINVSLTRYYEGRYLELHRDSTSQLTTVIVLTEDFQDGRFALSETFNNISFKTTKNLKLFDLGIGEGISFDGSKVFHGVLPVITGIRCALNIWMTNTDFQYHKLKQTNSLI